MVTGHLDREDKERHRITIMAETYIGILSVCVSHNSKLLETKNMGVTSWVTCTGGQ